MAATRHTLTADLADLLDDALPVAANGKSKVHVYLTTNLPDSEALVDTSANKVFLSGGAKEIAHDNGVFSVDLISTDSTDINVDGLQYRIVVSYISPKGSGANPAFAERLTWDSGHFELTADADLADDGLLDNIAAPPSWRSTFISDMGALRDDVLEISGLTGEDAAVGALVAGTGGAGPITRAALTASNDRAARKTIADRVVSDRLPMVAYSPVLSEQTLVDALAQTDGFKWAGNPSITFFDGKFWAFFDANATGAEGASDARVHVKTSATGAPGSWSASFQPFRNATYCTNPVATTGAEWQPCAVVVGDELWVVWRGSSPYLSKLAAGAGQKWTNYQIEWDGLTMRLSSTLTAPSAPAAPWSRYAEFDGEDDWLAFPATDPTLLRDGMVAIPMTLNSQTIDPEAPSGAPTFNKTKKVNVVAYIDSSDGSIQVSDPIPPPAGHGNYAAWEPNVVEAANGDIYVYSRNNVTALPDNTALLVATSRNRMAFTVVQPVDLLVPVSRPSAKQVSDQRWLMVHNDFPHGDPGSVNAFYSAGRKNATLFVSRRGTDDFVPGFGVSGTSVNQTYPQFCVHDGKVYVIYTEDAAGGRSLRLTVLDEAPTDDTVAYVHPRRYSEFIGGAPLHDDNPPSLVFSGQQRVTAASDLGTPTDLSFAVWGAPEANGVALVDTRPADASSNPPLMRSDGIAFSGVTLTHGATMVLGSPTLWCYAIDGDTGHVRFNVFVGGTRYQSDAYIKLLTIAGTPVANDTVTVAGTVFTWKASAATSTEVTIGGSVDASVANLVAKLAANGFSASAGATGSGRLYVAKADQSSFSVSYSGTAVSTASNILRPTAAPRFGYKNPTGSTVAGYSGALYDGRIYNGVTLTDANALSIYHEWNDTLGVADIAGTQTAPGAATMRLVEGSSAVDFPDIDAPTATASVATVSGREILTVNGEASAAVELPYETTSVSIRFRFDNAPEVGERYTIATIGGATNPIRLQVRGGLGGTVYIDSIGSNIELQDVTRWNTIELTVSKGFLYVGAQRVPLVGPPRVYLGSAFPQSFSVPANVIEFDLTGGSVADGRGAVPAALLADQDQTVSGDWTFNGDVGFGTPSQARTALGLGASAVLGTYWRRLFTGKGRLDAVTAQTTALNEQSANAPAGANGGLNAIYLDPADFPSGAKLRVRLLVLTNATAPACTFTAALAPVSAVAGAAANVTTTLGAAVSGSSAVAATPAASGTKVGVSTSFDFPVAGVYEVTLTNDVNMAANSSVVARVSVDVLF